MLRIPNTVFVPFEWDGKKWLKRDDLPRFKEPFEAGQFIVAHPEHSMRSGKPVPLRWVECHESGLIHEFLQGVGTPEWLSMRN